MEENYLIGVILAFLFGVVFFKKDSKIQINDDNDISQSTNNVNSNSSGVAKYLQKQQGELSLNKPTGVSRYLESKEEHEVVAIPTGVAKYLAIKDETPVSGVSKYMARQTIHAKEMAKKNVSGVEKYLNSHR